MIVLNIGAGRRQVVNLQPDWEYITLDQDEDLEPDIVCKLGEEHIPLPDDSVGLVIAIHVLEHIGKQGETKEWFAFWEEIYRVMSPDATLEFESPLFSSVWAWADPSHVRALSPESFIFFNQDNYRLPESAISPFRVRCDFSPDAFSLMKSHGDLASRETVTNFRGVLRPIKPLRVWWEDRVIPRTVELVQRATV